MGTYSSAPLTIECLACGAQRVVHGQSRDQVGACSSCDCVGWAPVAALTDLERIELRTRLAFDKRRLLEAFAALTGPPAPRSIRAA